MGWERKEKPTPSPSLIGGANFVLCSSGLAISGSTVKKVTRPKMTQLMVSMKVVGRMSMSAAAAIRPMTQKRNIRSVCVKYGLS